METPLDAVHKPQKKRTDFLNVLTILTFIGCAYALYTTLNGYFNADSTITEVERAIIKMEDSGASEVWVESMKQSLIALDLRKQNSVLFLISELLCIGLCVYGAILMRQVKSMGYYLWLAGEVLPWILSLIIIGSPVMSWFFLMAAIFPVAFIVMYSTQLKHME